MFLLSENILCYDSAMKEKANTPEVDDSSSIEPGELAVGGLAKSFAGRKYGFKAGNFEFGFGPIVDLASLPTFNGRTIGLRSKGRTLSSFGPKIK